jgi:hypothetical protein
MLVRMSDNEAWDEPEETRPADAGDDELESGQDRPQEPLGFRIAAAFGSVEMPSGPQHQLSEELARSLAPHLEAIQLQQRITEDLVSSLGGSSRCKTNCWASRNSQA